MEVRCGTDVKALGRVLDAIPAAFWLILLGPVLLNWATPTVWLVVFVAMIDRGRRLA